MLGSGNAQTNDCDKVCSALCNCSVKPECVTPIEREMQRHLQLQSKLCNQLGQIADELPYRVDRQKLLLVARSIMPTVKRAHRFEENRIFPQIEARAGTLDGLKQSLERLQFEHWEDESFAEDLTDGLIKFVARPETTNTDTLSYMLRGFFEGLRRHIAFEVDHIMPLLRQRHPLQVISS